MRVCWLLRERCGRIDLIPGMWWDQNAGVNPDSHEIATVVCWLGGVELVLVFRLGAVGGLIC